LVYIYTNYKLTCPRQEYSDIKESATRFNNRLAEENIDSSENSTNISLLDPNNLDENDEEYEELIEARSDSEKIEDSEVEDSEEYSQSE